MADLKCTEAGIMAETLDVSTSKTASPELDQIETEHPTEKLTKPPLFDTACVVEHIGYTNPTASTLKPPTESKNPVSTLYAEYDLGNPFNPFYDDKNP